MFGNVDVTVSTMSSPEPLAFSNAFSMVSANWFTSDGMFEIRSMIKSSYPRLRMSDGFISESTTTTFSAGKFSLLDVSSLSLSPCHYMQLVN